MDHVLHDIPQNPMPEPHRSGYFTAHDGVRLRYGLFKSTRPAKGTVVLVHGRSECIEKYFETIRDLTEAGLWVATYDLRGQGLSDRPLKDRLRGHVRRFEDYEKDLTSFIESVALPDGRLPLYLLAHSTGGLIALSAAPRLGNRIQRMVLSAPFVGLHGEIMAARKIFALARLASLSGFGTMAFSKGSRPPLFDGNPLTGDEKRFARNISIAVNVPELALGPPSARWLHECDKAIRRVQSPAHLTRITIPTLVIAPMQDGVVPFSAQEHLARNFRAGQILPIAGARHEVFQEQDRYRTQALAALHAFIPGSDADANLGGEENIEEA
ncbi:alpha/beta fold hydrolase [Allorhizobium undicola]|uniref:alpha/beta fold hydrolase n=1 Tax=Allorhizobium undicola TaxID=78527 RepID=UPI00048688B7|nr:alpha/beta hydrolase [Allorhizobium undicola]